MNINLKRTYVQTDWVDFGVSRLDLELLIEIYGVITFECVKLLRHGQV